MLPAPPHHGQDRPMGGRHTHSAIRRYQRVGLSRAPGAQGGDLQQEAGSNTRAGEAARHALVPPPQPNTIVKNGASLCEAAHAQIRLVEGDETPRMVSAPK